MRHVCLVAGTLVAAIVSVETGQAAKPSLQWSGAIPLTGVKGRIDHLAVDLKNQRLFVAALGNNTLEVLDLDRRSRYQTLSTIPTAPGARTSLFVPSSATLYLAVPSRGDQEAEVRIFRTVPPE